jgi:hypothetical protein
MTNGETTRAGAKKGLIVELDYFKKANDVFAG